MATMKYEIFIVTVILTLTRYSNGLQRTLHYAFNENCNELCKNTNTRLIHVQAIGINDTIHYLWDFTKNPTIFVAVTSTESKLQIKWPNYLSRSQNSINFTEKPIYTFGVAIQRLLEFNDVQDTARIDEVADSNISELKLTNFEWQHKNVTNYDNLVEFYTVAKNYTDSERNESRLGNIQFLVHGFGTLNHSRITPCMLHTENATQVDIVIDHLQTKKGFSKSRFAMELLIVSENYPNETLNFDTKRKLDDEFTPGIFEVMELTTPNIYKKQAYLQWRPVSFTGSYRDISNSTGAVIYPVKNATVNNYFGGNNLLYMYYGDNMYDVLLQRMNISFGTKSDGFYKETKFSTWTFLIGYGNPAEEKFSSIVLMIISIGVGLPLLILMISGIYVCLRRKPRQIPEIIIR